MSKNRKPPTPDAGSPKISPSQFMRELRPEYYSDTRDRVAYDLDGPTLEYHLETITKRNQTHDFELFCRKLCERSICPNLRPASGPEGGGDSKADTETYPVADEIAGLTYVGSPAAGKERWAFAFSAKETWSEKVRSDVDGIVATGRNYDRIICVTSRFSRARDRSRIEDELSTKLGLPVTIHDRSWIVAQIIDKDRKDIAFNYLGVGKERNDPLRLGPTDYSRLQQLTDIERSLDDPSAFDGMKRQRAMEALLAAKLSRGLERPRTETDGRFMRAVRLADEDGMYHDKLQAQYELIWTGFWWYDDVALLNSAYDSFETLALQSDNAEEVLLLNNLNQLLVNSVVHHLMTRDECKLDERTAKLRAALEPMADNRERPNNRLEARSILLTMKLNALMMAKDEAGLSRIWGEYEEILDEAAGLGEFDFDGLKKMIDVGGQIAGRDPKYTQLVEKLARVVSERTSEAEGALILLKRAQELDFDDNLEIIRLLGRTAIALAKKEHNDSLVDALQLLTLAYRSAGLIWAVRASCVFAAASIIVGAEGGELPVTFVPTMKIWSWIALELRHVPDFIAGIQLLNGSLQVLPLDDESKQRVREDLQELDAAFGAVILNLSEGELARFGALPDILEGLGLYMSRTALLYATGHEAVLRADGSLPAAESDAQVLEFLSLLKSQPVADEARYALNLNEASPHTLSSGIMGMALEVAFDGTDRQTKVAELVLGSVEAFFATAIAQRVMPHTEAFRIRIVDGEGAEPDLTIDPLKPSAVLSWPLSLDPAGFEHSDRVGRSLATICGLVLAATCLMDNAEALLEKLFADEAAHQRLTMVKAALTSYHRMNSRDVSRLEHWRRESHQTYALKQPLPTIPRVDLSAKRPQPTETSETSSPKTREPTDGLGVNDHRSLNIRSVIDIHAWDTATWRGTAFPVYDEPSPAILAFMFENREGAEAIFGRWRERFGGIDVDDQIRISIVRHLPRQPQSHYCVVVAAKQPEGEPERKGQLFILPNRSMTMEPTDSVNLDGFLKRLATNGSYFIFPAMLKTPGQAPELLSKLAIRKSELQVREASDIEAGEIDSVALRRRA